MTEEVKDQKEDITPSEDKTEENKDEGKPETTDYKAELEKVKKQLGQAEYTILKLKREQEKDESGEEKPERESVEEIARKEAAKLFANAAKSQVKIFARTMAENDDELDLIMFHYENTISPTGDIEIDIRRAKLLANEGRIGKDLEQARRAALSKETKGQIGGGGQKQPIEEGPPAMDEQSKKILTGFKWDSKRKGWIGPSGRFHSQAEIDKSIVTKIEK